jgi:hypothetical protein
MTIETYYLDELELAEIEDDFQTGFWFNFKRFIKELLRLPYIRLN